MLVAWRSVLGVLFRGRHVAQDGRGHPQEGPRFTETDVPFLMTGAGAIAKSAFLTRRKIPKLSHPGRNREMRKEHIPATSTKGFRA